MKSKPIQVWEQRLVVRIACGVGGVLDMMRYDSCFPASGAYAGKLARITQGGSPGEDNLVEFIRRARADCPPSSERWRSFGCEVISWERLQ